MKGANWNTGLLLVLCLYFAIAGCVTTRNTDEPWSYGNFCGPGWPDIESTSTQDRIDKLTAIQSADDIDEMCKEHDICYVSRGRNDVQCDKDLRRNMLAMQFEPAHKSRCMKVRNQVLYAFSCFQSTGHRPSSWVTAVFTVPAGMAMCALSTPSTVIGSLSDTPAPGTCMAINDYKKYRRDTEMCFAKAGSDIGKISECSRKFSPH